ncbi:MAG: DNA-binding protein [Cocleimonas sp.]|nr:DNA-binding protein [Cocleimonas sp.]
MATTLNYLLEKYGPLMTLEALAKTLDRSPQGLRVSLNSKSEISNKINGCRSNNIGRRMYFKTEAIANIIDGLA